jgi:hypothetical protein
MNWNKVLSITAVIVLIFASGCSLLAAPGGGQPTAVPLDTQVAQIVAGTLAAQTLMAIDSASGLTTTATAIPQFTPTPLQPAASTFTVTPAVPMVSVSVNTNCRSGPGVLYSILGVLPVGQSAQVVGQNTLSGYWIVNLSPQNVPCWLWNQYATVTGNTSGLPLVTPPAIPTPAGSFKVAYSSTQTCSGGTYGLKFVINNTGHLSWESEQVKATDVTAGVTETVAYDIFPNYYSADCSLINSIQKLDPGESGTTSVFGLPLNPAGHTFKVNIEVCSKNGLGGICTDLTLNFKL